MTQDELTKLADCCWEDRNGLNTFDHLKFSALVAAEQAKQEPVAWAYIDSDGSFMDALDRQHGAYQTPLYAAPVRTKDLTEPLIDELRECRDLLMCVESCSRNNFENLAYERVQAIDAVIAADRKLNGVDK